MRRGGSGRERKKEEEEEERLVNTRMSKLNSVNCTIYRITSGTVILHKSLIATWPSPSAPINILTQMSTGRAHSSS